MMSRFTHQNQMEYFNADYSEEIIKNVIYIGIIFQTNWWIDYLFFNTI